MVTVEEQNGLGHGCVNSNQIPSCIKGEILAKWTFLLKLSVYILYNSSISELAATSSTSSESPAFFVPTKKTSKVKARKDAIFNDMLEIMKTVVNNDPMRNYLEYATEEAERNRQHEFQLVQMLMHHESPQLQLYKQFQMSHTNESNDNYKSYLLF